MKHTAGVFPPAGSECNAALAGIIKLVKTSVEVEGSESVCVLGGVLVINTCCTMCRICSVLHSSLVNAGEFKTSLRVHPLEESEIKRRNLDDVTSRLQ